MSAWAAAIGGRTSWSATGRLWEGRGAGGGCRCLAAAAAAPRLVSCPSPLRPLPRRCCVQCGRVLEDTAFSADVTFQKDAGGESTVLGQFVNEAGVARGIG